MCDSCVGFFESSAAFFICCSFKMMKRSVSLLLKWDPVKLIGSSTSTTPPAKPVRRLSMEDVKETRTDSLQSKSARRSVAVKVSSAHFSNNFCLRQSHQMCLDSIPQCPKWSYSIGDLSSFHDATSQEKIIHVINNTIQYFVGIVNAGF